MMVTIIIPVFNTPEDKIRRCLDSIIAQTFVDFECIIVDDGSTNDFVNIIDEYASLDSRFKVVHKRNGGVSSARNKGLELAKGEWLVFVDSDDSLEPNHLSLLMKATADDVDIVMTGFRFLHPNKTTEHGYRSERHIDVEAIRNFVVDSDFLKYQVPWDRTYRNKKGLSFDEKLSLGEDRLFCYQYLMNCKGIATIDKITYVHDGTDETTLSYRTYPSVMNKHRYSVFKSAISCLKKYLGISKESLLDFYFEAIYSDLINSYKKEGRIFCFHTTRLLHKFNLL